IRPEEKGVRFDKSAGFGIGQSLVFPGSVEKGAHADQFALGREAKAARAAKGGSKSWQRNRFRLAPGFSFVLRNGVTTAHVDRFEGAAEVKGGEESSVRQHVDRGKI